jgi:UDP-N-acetylmuramoylalanine--D-glutamate ligase
MDSEFHQKNVLVMGLGVHGGGLGVVRWMAKQGAHLRVTDLRTADKLQSSIAAIQAEGIPVTYTLGEHREDDFRWADLVVRNQAVPPTSPWLALARSLGKPVEMEMTIFLRLCPGPVVAVTGTKGKSTTATWTWEMLRHWRPDALLAGNLRVSALEALPRITSDTPVVLELSSFQLEAFERPDVSVHIAGITNLSPDHLDRYKSMEEYGDAKKMIFKNQRSERGDWTVFNADHSIVSAWAAEAPAGVAWFGLESEPHSPGVFLAGDELVWHSPDGATVSLGGTDMVKVPGRHNLANAACAAAMSLLAGAPADAVRAGLASFTGVADRIEYLATLRGVRFINDTTSTTPASTEVALRALEGDIVLIAGGADKGLDFAALTPVVAERTLGVVLLDGTATNLMEQQFREGGVHVLGRYDDFAEAVKAAWRSTPEGGVVLLSPGTASFGMFRNEFDRGEQFKAIVAQLAGR